MNSNIDGPVDDSIQIENRHSEGWPPPTPEEREKWRILEHEAAKEYYEKERERQREERHRGYRF